MPQKLINGPSPFRNEMVCESSDIFRCRLAVLPHRWLAGFKMGMLFNQTTVLGFSALISVQGTEVETYASLIVVSTT